ncbi:MAG: HmuY family protein [Treponema sp.]|jgi:hypothetical protein|nr:HmuY family protein [Treponema sp.]
MKHNKILLGILALFCAAVLFTGCDNSTNGGGGGEGETLAAVTVVSGERKYFSLTTGKMVPESESDTKNWDIGFTRYSVTPEPTVEVPNPTPRGIYRIVLTNSGVTAEAEGSGGLGGVWYSGTTNFSNVTLADKGEDTDYTTDVTRYINAAMFGDPDPLGRPMNVMTYVGYSNEPDNDGKTAETYFSNSYLYNKDQFYNGSMGNYTPTNKVYIIRHADGETYSKIQIYYEYVGTPATDVYRITHEILPPVAE